MDQSLTAVVNRRHPSAYFVRVYFMGLLPNTSNCWLRMRRECWERFPCHRGLAIPIFITAQAWRMYRDAWRDLLLAVSFSGGKKLIPGIPAACPTDNCMCLVSGPYERLCCTFLCLYLIMVPVSFIQNIWTYFVQGYVIALVQFVSTLMARWLWLGPFLSSTRGRMMSKLDRRALDYNIKHHGHHSRSCRIFLSGVVVRAAAPPPYCVTT